MSVIIVYNHPSNGSYCHAILGAVSSGLRHAHHEVDLMHLDNDGFDPAISEADLKAFAGRQPVDPQVIDNQRLQKAHRLIFIFPIWWDIMPATTKDFIDRVLFPGVLYDHYLRASGLVLLKNLKRVAIITTMNKPKIMYLLLIGNLTRKVTVRSVFKTTGYRAVKWISFTAVKPVRHGDVSNGLLMLKIDSPKLK